MKTCAPTLRLATFGAVSALLAACGSAPKQATLPEKSTPPASSSTNANKPLLLPKANSGRGAYYKDDGPGEDIPPGLENTVEPIPMLEPLSSGPNKPYVVFGKTYTPIADMQTPLVQRGVASWYGKKFHGARTSSGEPYDMYKITAAHPTLPIPSYARVSNLSNGRQIIVRINDRGPFHANRIIDLSYTAALKLDILGKGSSQIEVERLLPADIERMAENRKNQQPQTPAVTVAANTTASNKISIDDYLGAETSSRNDGPVRNPSAVSDNNRANSVSNSAAYPQSNAEAGSGNGFYLQLGAFALRANAEAMLNHLKGRANASFRNFDIVQQGSLYRLYSGPFSNRNEASAALAQTGDLGIGKAMVVQR